MRLDRAYWIASLSMLSLVADHPLAAQEEGQGEVQEEVQSGVSPALACFELARAETLLTASEAELLCRGAFTMGPVLCYIAAQDRLFLSTDQRISLCRCARGIEPVNCFDRARRIPELTTNDAFQFCMPIIVDRLWPDCTPREIY